MLGGGRKNFMMKWTSLVWALGAVGFIGGMGVVVEQHLTHPKTSATSISSPKTAVPKKSATTVLEQTQPITATSPTLPPAQVLTTSTPPRTMVSFRGHGVSETNPDLTPVVLPRDFPMASNPVEFYTSNNFALAESFAGTIQGEPFTVQIYSGTTAPVLALAIANNGTPIATQIFGAPIAIAAFRHDSVIVEADSPNQAPVWYACNLITGAIRTLSGAPAGFNANSPNIQGIPPGLLRNTISPNNSASVLQVNITGSSLEDTLVKEVNSMLLTSITPSQVMVSQTSSGTAVLSALQPTRWQSIAFKNQGGTWVPTQIQTQVGSMTLTYDVQGNAVVLPYPEMQAVQKNITLGSYSALDTQTGALARLPINLEGATTVGTINTAKIRLQDQNHTLVALTYEAHANGNTFYVPIGWYWFTGLPSFLASEVSAQASTSSSTPPSSTTSPNGVVSSSTSTSLSTTPSAP